MNNTTTLTTNLAELVRAFYDELFEQFQDEELAELATAACISELLGQQARPEELAA